MYAVVHLGGCPSYLIPIYFENMAFTVHSYSSFDGCYNLHLIPWFLAHLFCFFFSHVPCPIYSSKKEAHRVKLPRKWLFQRCPLIWVAFPNHEDSICHCIALLREILVTLLRLKVSCFCPSDCHWLSSQRSCSFDTMQCIEHFGLVTQSLIIILLINNNCMIVF